MLFHFIDFINHTQWYKGLGTSNKERVLTYSIQPCTRLFQVGTCKGQFHKLCWDNLVQPVTTLSTSLWQGCGNLATSCLQPCRQGCGNLHVVQPWNFYMGILNLPILRYFDGVTGIDYSDYVIHLYCMVLSDHTYIKCVV